MVVDLITILQGYGVSIIDQIRQNLASTGTNATGKTSKSLKYVVKEEGGKTILKVTGKPYFAVVETGRRATPEFTKPSEEFVALIIEWMNAKGLVTTGGGAYGIAKSIHKKGTPPTGNKIFSNVINKGLIDTITKDSLQKFASEFTKNIVAQYGRNSN